MQDRRLVSAVVLGLCLTASAASASPGDARVACRVGCLNACMQSMPEILKARGGWYSACLKSTKPDATITAICKAHERSCNRRCRKRCNF